MYRKIEQILIFEKKRNTKLITPCCFKSNKNSKFVTYKNYPEIYGYCHSCGKATLPPTIYEDDKGNQYYWDCNTNTFKNVLQLYDKPVLQRGNCNTNESKFTKYIDFQAVNQTLKKKTENNLLWYLRQQYCNTTVNYIKELYYIGTSKTNGTVMWNINIDKKVQKAKVFFYTKQGKRKQFFNVPYKNEDGYYYCLYGEHLLKNNKKPIVLVESEKTAIVCAIEFPEYIWLSFGGINGMTNDKMKVLSGKNILIVPDLSENARRITLKKIEELKELNINAKMWDLSNGMSDFELKEIGIYNMDLEDFLRVF